MKLRRLKQRDFALMGAEGMNGQQSKLTKLPESGLSAAGSSAAGTGTEGSMQEAST